MAKRPWWDKGLPDFLTPSHVGNDLNNWLQPPLQSGAKERAALTTQPSTSNAPTVDPNIPNFTPEEKQFFAGLQANPTDQYFLTQLQNYDTSSIDIPKLKSFLQSQGNWNDTGIKTWLASSGLTPGYQKSDTIGSDPLAMQAMFSQVIKPYLANLSSATQFGINDYNKSSAALQEMVPGESAGMKNALAQMRDAVGAGLQSSGNAAQQQVLNEPGQALILNALRGLYAQQLAGLSPTSTGTTPTARIANPAFSVTQVQKALNPKIP